MSDQNSDLLQVIADALREWQREELSQDFAVKYPTTLWIDRAETPARVALDAIKSAGYVVLPPHVFGDGRCTPACVHGSASNLQKMNDPYAPNGSNEAQMSDQNAQYVADYEPPTCRYCGGALHLFNKAPDAFANDKRQGWATDFSGDVLEDFICPARESTGRWPDGKPHEPAHIDSSESNDV